MPPSLLIFSVYYFIIVYPKYLKIYMMIIQMNSKVGSKAWVVKFPILYQSLKLTLRIEKEAFQPQLMLQLDQFSLNPT